MCVIMFYIIGKVFEPRRSKLFNFVRLLDILNDWDRDIMYYLMFIAKRLLYQHNI